MIESLTTDAEKRAQKAEELPAFSGVKLLHIKRQVAELLSMIGRHGIFDEYTRHDIGHVDEMLKILDWLIPQDTKAIMSHADWLMTVLAIYFHDLGLLVTRQEYGQRNASGFPEYRDGVLFAGDSGADYRAKIQELSPDQAERFLYQEFVRHKHAERISDWIVDRNQDLLGITDAVMSEVDNLLKPLHPQFRRDLALVCESHHLDDLADFGKYKVSQPYGNSDEETANLQYSAVLLRTADLLHITRDRAPSIAFRVLNPTDPLSQDEWAKQMAVTRVRSKLGLDREGRPDENAPRDTIEVHAYFIQENGFFGLTSYLLYAQAQISKSYDWVRVASKQCGARHQFPWRYIDDSNIETEGFLRDQFEFTIDQAKILDLLTGHTLYNDTTVVLRELAQNALDAVRLQHLVDQQAGCEAEPGRVEIHWDSQQRVLSVEDTGTGMTQAIIERHLLKVGASLYQDPDFRRRYPTFSAISRFGIGLLSAFMVADTVEIFTCHTDDDRARHLSLRSVHGKYLIRLLDKQADEVAKRLAPHGTLVKLSVRPSAEMSDVIETARRWVVVPGCEVTVRVDDAPPVRVGFPSPKEAVLEVLHKIGVSIDGDSERAGSRRIRVNQEEVDSITLAYALEWSEYFREWSFLRLSGFEISEEEMPLLGTCVEGVRVEFGTPGFEQSPIVAIADAKGPNAPKTNVVRSGLEATPKRDALLRTIYSIYCNHVRAEMQELQERRKFSLTWATQEARYLLSPLLADLAHSRYWRPRNKPVNERFLLDAARELPVLLVERDGLRQAVSPADFGREQEFWTIDSQFLRFAEMLMREAPGRVSLSDVVDALHLDSFQLPEAPVLCSHDPVSAVYRSVFAGRDVDLIQIYPAQRRVDCRWVMRADPPRWYTLPEEVESKVVDLLIDLDARIRNRWLYRQGVLMVGQSGIEVLGRADEVAVRALDTTFVLPGSVLAKRLPSWLSRALQGQTDDAVLGIAILFNLVGTLLDRGEVTPDAEVFVSDHLRRVERRFGPGVFERLDAVVDRAELYDTIENTNWRVFDVSAWLREEDE